MELRRAMVENPDAPAVLHQAKGYGFPFWLYVRPIGHHLYAITLDIDTGLIPIKGRELLACNTTIKIDGERVTGEPVALAHIGEVVTASAMNVLDLYYKTR